MRRFGIASVVVVAGALVLASTATAGGGLTRYASPTGTGTECTQASPCSIRTAIDSGPSGSPVLLESGTYDLGSTGLFIDNSFSVGAVDPANPPLLTGTSTGSVVRVTGPGSASLRDVRIQANSQNAALLQDNGAQTVERVVVEQQDTTIGGTACAVQSGSIKNSVCWNSGGGDALAVQVFVSGALTPTIRNVTAYADERWALYLGAFGDDVRPTITNSILAGNNDGAGDGGDIVTFNSNGNEIDPDIDYSNYSTINGVANPQITVPAPGSANNQTEEPLFADAATGDFRQAPTSPTLEAGTPVGVEAGETDLAGAERIQGTIDIGAYEDFGDFEAPTVEITKGPKTKTTSRKAKFVFEGSDDLTKSEDLDYECRLDAQAFAPCESPASYSRRSRGKHTFRVQATDGAGKTSDIAKYSWKVVKKKRK